MKNDTTFKIEQDKLLDLMNKKQFEEADKLVTRMLSNYNKLDYDLLLKRARIRQCQIKYEDAIPDAYLALNILPHRKDAYHVLSDLLMALNDHEQALKLLSVLKTSCDKDSTILPQYEMIKSNIS